MKRVTRALLMKQYINSLPPDLHYPAPAGSISRHFIEDLLFLSFRFRGATIFPNLVGLQLLVVESRE